MDPVMRLLQPGERFRFACSRRVPCFNECCRDLNQFLTPYDILRLKRALNLPSHRFLARYTTLHSGPQTGLPVVTLKASNESGRACPFVTPSGCRVYPDRPSSCRTYPLMRMASRSRASGRVTEQYVLLQEAHCRGFAAGPGRTAAEWIADQGLAPYNRMNDMMLPLISLKNRRRPGALDARSRDLFRMACYDLDAFRSEIEQHGALEGCDVDAAAADAIHDSDEALLELGHRWIKWKLFGPATGTGNGEAAVDETAK